MPHPAPRPRVPLYRLSQTLWVVACLLATGCGREPVVRLADFVPHQRDHVTTRSVPAHSDLAERLAADGWRVEESDGGASTLSTTHDRARLWFFSANGRSIGAELTGEIFDPAGGPRRSLFYRLNDGKRGSASRQEDNLFDIAFRPGKVRIGWNALDLFIGRREGDEEKPARLQLRGFRILDGAEPLIGDSSPQTLRVEEGALALPGESLFEATFEVPRGGRLRADVTSDLGKGDPERLVGSLSLLDAAGAEHDLGGFRLDPGDRDRLDIELEPWVGEIVRVELSIAGPRGASALLRKAGVYGRGRRQMVEAPIRPAPTTKTGRLGKPNVIVIVLDAARADAFGAYGAEHPTPIVDALARVGTRFENAQSPSSWTGQSIPALVSGFYPDTLHTERWGDPLPDDVSHLAELMASAGYRTVLWSQHPIYTRTESLQRGFHEMHYNGRRKRTMLPPRRILFERQRPTFALIHLLPPHSPYRPPPPFRGAYSAGYQGKLSKLGALGRIGKKRLLKLTQADRDYAYARYLENVAFADWLVGQLMQTIQDARRFENSIIVVTSDHGEAFLEHGQFMHSRELYQEFIRIPLVIKWPGGTTGFARTVEEPASLVDLVPTLVDGLDLPGGERGFQGRSLLPRVFEGEPLERSSYATTRGLGDLDRIAKPRRMLEQDGWRLIHDPVAARTELYDVSLDPAEAVDLAPEQPARTRYLLQRLSMQNWFNRGLLQLGPRAEIELDPELVEELKALGYL